ncbi:uncharacterized protein TNCV_3642111 [Trichonephila clavipes]|nr:uncharacterized protein TNCV_3642111 [Trichonephila clavipes]
MHVSQRKLHRDRSPTGCDSYKRTVGIKYNKWQRRWRHKTFNAFPENKPYGDDHLIQKIECVDHVQKRMGTRLRKLKLVYSKKKLSDGKTIGGKDLSHPALLKKCLGDKTKNPNESLNSLISKFCPKTIGSSLQIAEIAANLATSVFNDGNKIFITILEKFGLKININVCVSLAERDNRRMFTSRQRRKAPESLLVVRYELPSVCLKKIPIHARWD